MNKSIISTKFGDALISEEGQRVCGISFDIFPFDQSKSNPIDKEWLDSLIRKINDQSKDSDIDIRLLYHNATEFQRTVWDALRTIPYGETRSYAQIAEQIGKPKAHRAVALACSANNIALLVPCHRVIYSDGSIGGYRWGISLKKRILESERNL